VSRRILVLGASGFIGRHVIQALAADGSLEPVAAWHRSPLPTLPGIRQVQLDGCDQAALAAALATVDGVVNCVAGSPDTIARNGRALVAAAAALTRQQPRIVQLSSMAVYGSRSGTVTEETPLLGDVGAYSAAKVEVERAAAALPDTVILRPGCVYGPDSSQWSVRIASLLLTHRIGDLGAGGDGFSNLVHVDDVVAAVLASLRVAGAGGRAYNLAAQPRVRWNEYFTAYAMALGAVPLRRISRRRLKVETRLLAPGLKVAGMLAGRLRLGSLVPEPIPPSLARLWQQEIHLVSTRAERELGIAWTSLEQGLASTVAGLRRAGLQGDR
jgi:nucleoside-diphosphate-sugar epimerase